MNFDLISPQTEDELLRCIAEYQQGRFCFGAGCTDLLPQLEKQPIKNLSVINLGQLRAERFREIKKDEGEIRVGTLVTAHDITAHDLLRQQFPVLHEAAEQLASRQIRQVATVGGNICTASPAGDLACALVALRAQCDILSAAGATRMVPLEKFIIGVRQTDLRRDEILRSIVIPVAKKRHKIYSHFLKIGTRNAMEIAVVSLAYHVEVDGADKVIHAGLAIGSAAPRIPFAQAAGDFLLGKRFSQVSAAEAEEFAAKVASYAAPISDLRASAWYRQEVLRNISRSIFEIP